MLNDQWNKLFRISQDLLAQDKELIEYLKARGVSKTSIINFQLGKFPPLDQLISLFNPEWLRKYGLLYDGSYSPYIKNSLIFPIKDMHANYIGLGGRTLLKDHKPKYINTKNLKKRHNLYGLDLAKRYISKEQEVFVVEGYMDVITAHQYGMKNTVGALGTAFGKSHMSLLGRLSKRINWIVDNDSSGMKSAQRWKDRLGLPLYFKKIANAKDINEYFNEKNGDVRNLISGKDLIDIDIKYIPTDLGIDLQPHI